MAKVIPPMAASLNEILLTLSPGSRFSWFGSRDGKVGQATNLVSSSFSIADQGNDCLRLASALMAGKPSLGSKSRFSFWRKSPDLADSGGVGGRGQMPREHQGRKYKSTFLGGTGEFSRHAASAGCVRLVHTIDNTPVWTAANWATEEVARYLYGLWAAEAADGSCVRSGTARANGTPLRRLSFEVPLARQAAGR
jgi:hypothetical protein